MTSPFSKPYLTLHCQKAWPAQPILQALNEAPSTCKGSNTATPPRAVGVPQPRSFPRRDLKFTKGSRQTTLCSRLSIFTWISTAVRTKAWFSRQTYPIALPNHTCSSSISYSETSPPGNIGSNTCTPPCIGMLSEKTWGNELVCSNDTRSYPNPNTPYSCYHTADKILRDDRIDSSLCVIIHDSDSERIHRILLTSPTLDESPALLTASMDIQVLQISALLPVPPLYFSTCRMPTYAEWCAWLKKPMPPAPVHRFCRPAFKHALFGQIVKRGENERLCPFFQHIVPAVTKHAFKTVALDASLRALEIRGRYQIDGYVEISERPFRWTDPAEPLVCHPLKTKALHIPSPKPFSIPHILIEFSSENNSNIIQANTAPSQQCPSGLTVLQWTSAAADCDIYEDGEFDYDPFYENSIEPSTPTSLRRIERCFFNRGDDDESTLIEVRDYSQKQSQLSYIPNATSCRNEVKARFFIDEDEDDGPPEYDDWFLSIAQRTQTQCS